MRQDKVVQSIHVWACAIQQKKKQLSIRWISWITKAAAPKTQHWWYKRPKLQQSAVILVFCGWICLFCLITELSRIVTLNCHREVASTVTRQKVRPPVAPQNQAQGLRSWKKFKHKSEISSESHQWVLFLHISLVNSSGSDEYSSQGCSMYTNALRRLPGRKFFYFRSAK